MIKRSIVFNKTEERPRCHCSVIQELPNNELMVIWYAGKREAHKSVGIMASWKPIKNEESAWSEPKLIHKTPNKADGNAILKFFNGKLYMFYNVIVGKFFPWTKVVLKKKVSEDYGRNWSDPETIIGKENKGYTVRNKPLIVEDRMIIPTGQEKILTSTSQMLITENGKDFHFSNIIKPAKGKCHQPTITQLSNGDILAFLRTNQDRVLKSLSKDLGETWSKPEKLKLKNPNSALDFVRTDDGELVLVWNNNDKQGGMMKSRKSLQIGYSPDEGDSWTVIKNIEEYKEDGRFAYPSIILGSDNFFHLTYTNRREQIKYVKFDKNWLIGQ